MENSETKLIDLITERIERRLSPKVQSVYLYKDWVKMMACEIEGDPYIINMSTFFPRVPSKGELITMEPVDDSPVKMYRVVELVTCSELIWIDILVEEVDPKELSKEDDR